MNGVVNVVFRVKTQQAVLLDQEPNSGELPLRQWRMEVVMLDKHGNETPAEIISYITYHLHPTFAKPKRKVSEPPFALEEIGWGEFDLQLICTLKEHGGTVKLLHDLSFVEDAYAIDFEVAVPYHQNPPLHALLSRWFDLEADFAESATKSNSELPRWVRDVSKLDEDKIQEFLQKVVSNPAVRNYLNKKPKNEEAVLCLSELPDELIICLGEFMNKHESLTGI